MAVNVTIRQDPANGAAFARRGELFVSIWNLKKGARDLGQSYALKPDNIALAQNWTYLLFASCNQDRYDTACRQLIEKFEESADRPGPLVVSRILILNPRPPQDRELLVKIAQRAVELDPLDWCPRHVLAGAYLRCGRYERALIVLDQLDDAKLVPASPDLDSWLAQILNDSLRAIALLKLGHADLGSAALARVVKSSALHLKTTPEQTSGERTCYWWGWYPITAFRHEAQNLLWQAEYGIQGGDRPVPAQGAPGIHRQQA